MSAARICIRFRLGPRYVGDVVGLTIEFHDEVTDELVDPSAFTVHVQPEGEDAVVYTYGTDANVTKTDDGIYRAEIDVTQVGRWDFAVHSTGPDAIGVEPGYFDAYAAI